MSMTDTDILAANDKSRPEVYAVTAMLIAIGALKTIVSEQNHVGVVIRQLEIAIDKLKTK